MFFIWLGAAVFRHDGGKNDQGDNLLFMSPIIRIISNKIIPIMISMVFKCPSLSVFYFVISLSFFFVLVFKVNDANRFEGTDGGDGVFVHHLLASVQLHTITVKLSKPLTTPLI
jgi:hypothetical protein